MARNRLMVKMLIVTGVMISGATTFMSCTANNNVGTQGKNEMEKVLIASEKKEDNQNGNESKSSDGNNKAEENAGQATINNSNNNDKNSDSKNETVSNENKEDETSVSEEGGQTANAKNVTYKNNNCNNNRPNNRPSNSRPNNSKPNNNSNITTKPNNNTNNNTSGSTNNTPSVENNSTSNSYISEIEQLIFQRVNAERAAASLKPLSYNNTMQKYARIKSKDMGDNNYFDHKDLNGQLITNNMKNDGVTFNAWGENIAYIEGSYNNASLAQKFMDNWMNSSGHRANILSDNYTSIGIGVYKIGNRYYATQEFYR